MKKSNLMLIVAFLFFCGTLVAFNFAMKAELDTGQYKDPYLDFNKLAFQNFDSIEVHGATHFKLKIMKGPFQVLQWKKAKEQIHLKQEGGKLMIEVSLKDKEAIAFPGYHSQYPVVIYCPTLAYLQADGKYTRSGKVEIDNNLQTDWDHQDAWYYNDIQVQGFEQSQLTIQQDHVTHVVLSLNKLKRLAAQVGVSSGSNSKLSILKGNVIQSADLDIKNKSTLLLDHIAIPELSYHFSDSAQAKFSGAALAKIGKQ